MIIIIYIYTKISLSVIVILYCIVCSLSVAVRSLWRLLFRLLNLSAAIVERSSLCTDAPPPPSPRKKIGERVSLIETFVPGPS